MLLGFSGGLDTSYCVKYFTDEKGYEVHSIIVNTGGFTTEELKQIEAHAYKLGVTSHTTVDAVKSYYDTIIKYLYLWKCFKKQYLSVKCKCRTVCQALHIAEHVKKLGLMQWHMAVQAQVTTR